MLDFDVILPAPLAQELGGSFFHTIRTVPRTCFASPPGESTYDPL